MFREIEIITLTLVANRITLIKCTKNLLTKKPPHTIRHHNSTSQTVQENLLNSPLELCGRQKKSSATRGLAYRNERNLLEIWGITPESKFKHWRWFVKLIPSTLRCENIKENKVLYGFTQLQEFYHYPPPPQNKTKPKQNKKTTLTQPKQDF